MGYATKANRSLTTPTVVRLLEIIHREAEEETSLIAREYYKDGAAVATAVCASLRGPEVFQLDLARMISHINMGKGGIMPDRPLKTGTRPTCYGGVIEQLQGRDGSPSSHGVTG